VRVFPRETLDHIRDVGKDDFGNLLEVFVDEQGGSPLRCCLRPAAPGDRLALIAYRPFSRPGPMPRLDQCLSTPITAAATRSRVSI
ncbi:MAG: hypothetical protein DLM70_01350, partial [Chloroflexi bacterium]